VKNIVLCFDSTHSQPESSQTSPEVSNAVTLTRLLGETDRQIVWHGPCQAASSASSASDRTTLRGRAVNDARAAIAEAYRFLVDHWRRGDEIYIFGTGAAASCGLELSRLLGTVGVMADRSGYLLDYALATYVLPRTHRTRQDWDRVQHLAARLAGHRENAVSVRYLGLWDATRMAGRLGTGAATESPTNVRAGRHAIGIDGGPLPDRLITQAGEGIAAAWFRGTHRDVTGARGACRPLADIALDWVMDGALQAGAVLRDGGCWPVPVPTDRDALAGSVPAVSLRRPPEDAAVHASVEMYLRAHPHYWRRMPARVVWADPDWLARGERLAPAARRDGPTRNRGLREVLTAAAS